MAKVIVMPKMGEAMEEGQITEWLVKEGDKVIYSEYAGTKVKMDGEEVIIVRQADILAIVE